MIRNNLLALLIHTALGAVLFLFGNLLFDSASAYTALIILGVFYLLYFVLSFLLARFHAFNTKNNKLYHVLLPSAVMLAVIAALYVINFKSDSTVFGVVVGLFGQPVEFILALTGDRLQRGFSIAGVVLQCLTPSPIIWLGLSAGGKGKLAGV